MAASGAFLALLLGLALFWPLGCSPKGQYQDQSLETRIIRARLLASVSQVVLNASQGPVYFTSADPMLRQLDLPRDVDVPLRLSAAGWLVGATSLGQGVLTLRPLQPGSLRVNGWAYRGEYRLVPVGDNCFDVVNHVDIEQYLVGVLAGELYASWSLETHKAQAIAARTYALYEKHVPREPRHWDVHADTRSQMYVGIARESPRARQAVEETAGVVLAYGPSGNERIFKAYYSSCCGGVTQAAMHAFREPYIEPLSDQYVGPLCSASPRFTWGPVAVRKEELTRRIRAWARSERAEKQMATVRTVEIEQRNRYGRPVRYLVTDERGMRYSLTAEELRSAVNTGASPGTQLYSGFVEGIVNDSDSVRFLGGHGSGHGVGMCQWCAEARARAGLRHEDILMLAYPGAVLRRAY